MSQSNRQNRPAHVVIDTAAFAHNLAQVKRWVPDSKIMAVIKADGYGHGMEAAASGLSDADEFGVNGLDDVHRLRAHGVDKTLSILSASLTLDELNALQGDKVRPLCYDFEHLSLFEQLDDSAGLSVWIKVDTGMGRLGFLPTELQSVYQRLEKVKGISKLSLMTHLANADQVDHPSNKQQIEVFTELAEAHKFSDISILNSAGVVSFANSANTQVRPGIVMYGISPTLGISAQSLGLQPVMTFKSQLISVKTLPSGSSIGYGSTYVLDQDSRVGIVAVGYGDGYPRHAPSGTPVLVNGVLLPLVGRVSMDMIAIDLGALPAKVGDEVVLWGEGNPIEKIAAAAGTIAYELSCGILPRVQRLLI
ncbi:MAG: alanine racemase [Cryomorphaceae bacterium]|jgi:alanine racemase